MEETCTCGKAVSSMVLAESVTCATCGQTYCNNAHANFGHSNSDPAFDGIIVEDADKQLALAPKLAVARAKAKNLKNLKNGGGGIVRGGIFSGAALAASTEGAKEAMMGGVAATGILRAGECSWYFGQYLKGSISLQQLGQKTKTAFHKTVVTGGGAAIGGAIGTLGGPVGTVVGGVVGGALGGYFLGPALTDDEEVQEAWERMVNEGTGKLDGALQQFFGTDSKDANFMVHLSETRVTKRYRHLSRVLHPDAQGGSERAFNQLYENFGVLLVFLEGRDRMAQA